MQSSMEMIADFLAHNRFALIGISHDPANFSVKLFEEFLKRGYDVVPVNPRLEQVGARKCFPRVQDIQPPVEAVLVMTSPHLTETVLRDCAEAGVRIVWMYSAGGQGSVSPNAIRYCEE